MKNTILFVMLVVCGMFVAGCEKDSEKKDIEVNILSIDSKGTKGILYRNRIQVGVEFKIGEKLFLKDFLLNQAQVAYYKDKKTIPLTLTVSYDEMGPIASMRMQLNGEYIFSEDISTESAKKLIADMRPAKN